MIAYRGRRYDIETRGAFRDARCTKKCGRCGELGFTCLLSTVPILEVGFISIFDRTERRSDEINTDNVLDDIWFLL